MKLPQIQIRSTYAQIQIETQPGEQTIEQPKANQHIEQPEAELYIERRQGKLTIDQTQARADMDLKSVFRRTEEFAQNGKQAWLEGLARRVRQGDQLMKIENKGNPIALIAKENSVKPEKSFNIGWIPSHFSVKTHYEPDHLDINWKVNKPIIDTEEQKPIIDFQPGKVYTSLKEKNSLSIDFINLKFKGINYEQEI